MTKTKVFSIRLETETLIKIRKQAKKEDRSVNYIISSILKKYYKK